MKTDSLLKSRPEQAPSCTALRTNVAQERLWFLTQMEEQSAAYTASAAFRIRGPLQVIALEMSFRAIVARHEVLRTTFPNTNGDLRQRLESEYLIELPLTDLTSLPEDRREDRARELARHETTTPVYHMIFRFAERYVRMLREYQPHGPYSLASWCVDGVLAFEMAQQLRTAREEVPVLILIDSFNPACWQCESQWAAPKSSEVPSPKSCWFRFVEAIRIHIRSLGHGWAAHAAPVSAFVPQAACVVRSPPGQSVALFR